MIGIWLAGLLRRRAGRLTAAAAGVAVAVALLASLGAFLAHSKATMTARAVHAVSVDWQVQVKQGTDPAAVTHLVQMSPHVRAAAQVGFAQSTGLSATTAGTTQTTGPGVVLGVPANYASLFSGELRLLSGSQQGVLVAQQTAANLHVAPGDTVTIGIAGQSPEKVRIAGVVDLPLANSLFQTVGAPPSAQPSAPPDNVLVLPSPIWHASFDRLAASRPELVSTQIHVLRDHQLPADPAAAFSAATVAGHNLEARSAGAAVVGNNLAAALDAARGDAAYAQVLFLFLGVPGAVLAGLLTATIASAGATRRRAEQALLRARGASARQLIRLAAVEAALVGVIGAALGIAAAAVVGATAFGTASFGTTTATAAGWAGAAAAAGLVIAAASILVPARRDLRESTVASGRISVARLQYPRWARYGLDAALLIIAGLVFSATSHNGYQLVLAPEGVPTLSVSYWALAGPALLWIGAGLLAWRLADLLLGRGRRVVAGVLRPTTGGLSGPISAGLARQRRPLVRAIVLLALALSFAASTATFNSTYKQQAEADAQLTNGADVTVTEPPGGNVPASAAAQLAAVPGVRAVQPIQHRFAYIGPDLQDLYGVSPATIRNATALQDAYFQGGSASSLMHTLATRPNSILVSAETVKDYQLNVGDQITLRLLDVRTRQPKPVKFRYVGIVSEFPTAPKDSFFITNANYIAQQTGSDAVGAFLVGTGGQNTSAVSHRLQSIVGSGATVTDISTVRKSVGSSLTSVDLAGLTRVELSFALVLAAAAGGLVFALGLNERRRTFAITTALGASRRQLRSMIVSEAGILTVTGVVAGAGIGWALSEMLVKVLTGVFDPPPSTIAVPWTYLTITLAITVLGLGAVSWVAARLARRPAIGVLRDL
jgi:putative ABC transport system permease protein